MDKRNILIIAGYDVLADKSPDHRKYVEESFWRGTADEVDLIFVVGGATNPDYPNLTEAEANFKILEDPFPDSKKDFESQRKKMLMKVLSHYGFPFNIIRRAYQRFHQKRVAWIKRKQAKALQKS